MRQRKIKNLETKYEEFSDIVFHDPAGMRGKWRQTAAALMEANAAGAADTAADEKSGREGLPKVYLEIGCGKGRFIAGMAKARPDCFFIGIEGNRSVLLRALEKARPDKRVRTDVPPETFAGETAIPNVAFIPFFVEDLKDWFEPGEVDGIYLNFSDPLPKTYNFRKRLTYRDRLRQYFDVMTDGGEVVFKTDNFGLFEFTLQEIRAADLRILEMTRDLHESGTEDTDIMTEYEEKFSGLGEKIKRVRIGKKRSKAADKERNSQMAEVRTGDEGIMAAYNGRSIPKEDKIFGISNRGRAAVRELGRENVINGTVGALFDDDGKLIVLESVDKTMKALAPEEYAEYAPIAGTAGFKEAIKRAAFEPYEPKASIGVVATPGGTGSIRNAVANYSCPGDKVLTHDWHWTPYNSISAEQGRSVETFELYDDENKFNLADFEYKVNKLLRIQDRLLIILNTPGNNPTGYSLTADEWKAVVEILNGVSPDKRVTVLLDVAYIDFAGDPAGVRQFLPVLEGLNDNVLPILAYSASKTFTFYGCRCAAMICMAPNDEIRDEFVKVCSYSARATWSNSPRGPQTVIEKIYADDELLAKVSEERAKYREMLLARGNAFTEEAAKAGLDMLPYRGGFFVSMPCDDPDRISAKLEEQNVFIIPMSKGLRVSLASIPESQARKLPAIIAEAMK
jgi:tRNA (guanine-N(7)-)-methyltransferase